MSFSSSRARAVSPISGWLPNLASVSRARFCVLGPKSPSTRKVTDQERAMQTLKGIGGKRLTYRRTDEAQAA
ncbi:hypothetical protein [Minwuia sp.]|uniref:hypothetical protein n=1 Tax=Minwuia sp. TaxID=2493630 RepID=UPI003A906EBA